MIWMRRKNEWDLFWLVNRVQSRSVKGLLILSFLNLTFFSSVFFRSKFDTNLQELSILISSNSPHYLIQLSQWIISFSSRHEGWSVEFEAITLPSVLDSAHSTSNTPSSNPKTQHKRTPTSSTLPFSSGFSSDFSVGPLSNFHSAGSSSQDHSTLSLSSPPVSAIWLWQTQASNVRNGEVVAVKPASSSGGLGSGTASSSAEKVILLLSSGPMIGTALGWTLIRAKKFIGQLSSTSFWRLWVFSSRFPFCLCLFDQNTWSWIWEHHLEWWLKWSWFKSFFTTLS